MYKRNNIVQNKGILNKEGERLFNEREKDKHRI